MSDLETNQILKSLGDGCEFILPYEADILPLLIYDIWNIDQNEIPPVSIEQISLLCEKNDSGFCLKITQTIFKIENISLVDITEFINRTLGEDLIWNKKSSE